MSLILNLLLVITAAFLLLDLVNAVKSLKAASWETVKGKIENWDMHYSADGEGTNLVINKLQYSYSVSENEYLSDRVGFGFPWFMDSFFVGSTIEKALESAPKLKVYYNPKSHRESTIIVGLRAFHIFKIFSLGIIIAFIYGASNAP